jgi:hypothetical protein
MTTTTTVIRSSLAGLAAIAALWASAGAAATPLGDRAASRMEPQELRALTIRSSALNCSHGRAETCIAPSELRTLQIRSEALNRAYGARTGQGASTFIPGVTDFPSRPAYVEPGWALSRIAATTPGASAENFHWGDAGIGAGLAATILILAAGALAVGNRNRSTSVLGRSGVTAR